MGEYRNFDAIQIGLASPEQIREWSRGEVKKPETINYRTLKPERDGLFCEKIFGPMKDWECHCGKYKRVRYKGIICDRCGVEVTKAKVRRERMGHIELAAPVSHIWYFKGIPSKMGLILSMSPRSLEKVLYFANYIVLDPKDTPLEEKKLLSEKEYKECIDKYGSDAFEVGIGAEAIKVLLEKIDLESLAKELREELESSTGQKKIRTIRKLEVVESFIASSNKPEWMIIDVIPVIPPDLRPMVQLDGGRFATSDLNDLYRRVINRNNRLKKLLMLGAPDIIVRNEKRMLQEAVDALIDNGRRGRPVTGPGNRPLKSLSDMLKGKQGRFRQNLLGKRVDYSGRSVIVVGPELKMYQCGLPKEMALELFKPFVMKKLTERGIAHNIKSAKRMVERVMPQVWDVLEEVIQDHPVMLNRAPTLHRLGIQAFQPILVEGRAIKLHPLACTAYNADFDGDQMAVHVPLSVEAQAEARFLMLAAHNILKPSDGKPVCVPTQDMILGSYYLTMNRDGAKGEGRMFSSPEEALMAYQNNHIDIHAKIKVRMRKEIQGEIKSGIIETTPGKIIFNESIPQTLGFVDRTKEENIFKLEVDFLVSKKTLGKIIDKCYLKFGPTETSIMLDKIKATGYHYSCIGAITISVSDMTVPEEKKSLLEEAEKTVDKIEKMYRRGFISEEERYKQVIDKWTETTENVANVLMDSFDKFNPIFMMADSGARGSKSQIKQLAGMRGLMSNPSGKIIERPIKASFREGLNVLEYFMSTHGARKGNADTALKTADSGYLTRRLVDVSQDVIIREEDCGTTQGYTITEIKEGNEMIESLAERLTGRYSAEDIKNPQTGEVIVKCGEYMNVELAGKVEEAGVKEVKIRSVFTCHSKVGVCAKCYGMNMATGDKINIGESVGITAAQSIGEPGTQLTMRTFHTGGVAGADITNGLPRVEELFEARKPKGLAIVSEANGVVRIEETKKKRVVVITDDNGEEHSYDIPFGSRLSTGILNGNRVEAGDAITQGSINPHDIIRIKGVEATKNYLLSEVQKVYRLQGVDINDKHLEVVIRQMTRKIKIEESGDTNLLPGTLIDVFEFNEANEKAISEGGQPAEGKVTLLGITKAALATDSFLSAASFQETTRVLTEAAIKGKIDPLVGLKENVILGKLIPAGTGMTRYRTLKISTEDAIAAKEQELENAISKADAAENGPDVDETMISESLTEKQMFDENMDMDISDNE
ncbi:DNA-directed RNA polymerase subunit beta' [Hathewaya proteolytica DSM 3090]|uniref:DNA-directed RNA polymerase subunit beta' n=1 Tax=Hathewaya proteolytica DSM 3090 TaxID=1121331 RepID=A0A1M6T1L8_9CLOT|nr:DNA-directed RNA polymerase subunit beta' [Hathewaya proteolytica]SHK50865.1 DNA-directed RNA polymerase subunit beta' [Hathewaya proteolytica DSM 3090]